MSKQLAEHAAGCAACASLLREAVRVMADAEDADEHRFLEGLKSSQQPWQSRMAQELSGDRRSIQDLAVRRRTSWNWWLAGAFAVGAIALAFVWLAIVHPRSSGSRAQVNVPPKSTSPPASNPDVKGLPRPLIAAIVLEPGITRGVESEKLLKLAPDTQSAAVTLLFLEAPPPQLSLEVVDSSGREIWSKRLTMTIEAAGARQLMIEIPAHRLPAGDYRVLTLHVANGETEHVADYSFRVIR